MLHSEATSSTVAGAMLQGPQGSLRWLCDMSLGQTCHHLEMSWVVQACSFFLHFLCWDSQILAALLAITWSGKWVMGTQRVRVAAFGFNPWHVIVSCKEGNPTSRQVKRATQSHCESCGCCGLQLVGLWYIELICGCVRHCLVFGVCSLEVVCCCWGLWFDLQKTLRLGSAGRALTQRPGGVDASETAAQLRSECAGPTH